VRDEGSGFSLDDFDSDGSYHGLTPIKNLVNEVSFNETGNEIKLVKHREDSSNEPTIAVD